MGENQLSVIESTYRGQTINVSTSMLRARENTSLLGSKIETLAILYSNKTGMKQKEKKDANGNPYSVNYVIVPAKEISVLMGRKSGLKGKVDGKTYSEIRNAAVSLKQKLLIIEDKEEQRFVMKSMYGDVAYDNGSLYVEFEPSMEKYFLGLKKSYSKLSIPILFSYKKNGGLQLYRLLKSYAYAPNLPDIDTSLEQENLPTYSLTWNMTDLRMQMGYVDISQSKLREEGSKSRPNWEKMEKAEKNPQYKRWSDFKSRVIDPGVKEINEISDIYIKDVIKETSGKGGKVTGLTFVIQHNKGYYLKHGKDVKKTNSKLSAEQKEDFIDELSTVISEKLKPRELKSIAEESGYDMGRIKELYKMAQNSKEGISNLTGWLIKGLRDGYTAPVGMKKKNSFQNFKERDYDFAELEKKFARN